MGEERFYRNWCENKDLVSFNAIINETDLYIRADIEVEKKNNKKNS
ncbi:MAG: hypothetical protein ABIB46_01040 [bacterium]